MKFIFERDPNTRIVRIEIEISGAGSLSDFSPHFGIAYITARALLRGTESRSYSELTSAIENLGGSICIAVDPTHATFHAQVLAKNIDLFLDLLQDIFNQPKFDEVECAKLKKLLTGELQASLEDAAVLSSRGVLRTIYAGTLLSHPPQGTLDGISAVSSNKVQEFFKSNYVKSAFLIGVTSPFADEQILSKLDSRFSTLRDGEVTHRHLPQTKFSTAKAHVIPRKGMSTLPLFVVLPGIADADPKWLSLEVGNLVFGGDFTSRLMQVLRGEHGWTYGVYSGFNQVLPPQGDPGLFSIYLFPSAEFASDAIATTFSMLKEYSSFGITADEFEQAKSAILNSAFFQIDTAAKRLQGRMRQELTGRPFLTPEQWKAQLNAITHDSVNSAIQSHFKSHAPQWVVVGDLEQLKPVFDTLSPGIPIIVLPIQP